MERCIPALIPFSRPGRELCSPSAAAPPGSPRGLSQKGFGSCGRRPGLLPGTGLQECVGADREPRVGFCGKPRATPAAQPLFLLAGFAGKPHDVPVRAWQRRCREQHGSGSPLCVFSPLPSPSAWPDFCSMGKGCQSKIKRVALGGSSCADADLLSQGSAAGAAPAWEVSVLGRLLGQYRAKWDSRGGWQRGRGTGWSEPDGLGRYRCLLRGLR